MQIYIFTPTKTTIYLQIVQNRNQIQQKHVQTVKKQPLKLKNLYIFYRKINTKRKPKNKKSVFLYEKHTNTTIILPINTKKRWMPT